MNEQNKPQIGQEAPDTGIAKAEQGSTARRLARRRLLIKGGATAAPVLLSLGSKPAMATGGLPCSHHKSGWASAGSRTTVDNGDHTSHSHGCTPGYWSTGSTQWPSGCSKSSTTFSSCLGSAPPSTTCVDKLSAALTCNDELVRHFAASYLNCKASKYGSNTIMTIANLQAWWTVCKNNTEASIGTDGKIKRSAAYWKSKELASPDSRAGGFLNLMKTINTKTYG